MIYHLVTHAELSTATLDDGSFRPRDLDAGEFVHCSGRRSLIGVANDYFASARGPVLVLEIDPTLLAAETRYEPPAPIVGGGTDHLHDGLRFPHVYGPLDVCAIQRVGLVQRTPDGYRWPRRFVTLEAYVRGDLRLPGDRGDASTAVTDDRERRAGT